MGIHYVVKKICALQRFMLRPSAIREVRVRESTGFIASVLVGLGLAASWSEL